MTTRNLAIYIYDQAEVLDFSGPFEVFSTANRFATDAPFFNVFFVAEQKRVVKARGGFHITPHFDICKHPEVDVLMVVGGVHDGELQKSKVIDWISQQAKHAEMISSVCTGAFLLAKANVITHHKVTTHWQDIDDLRRQFPTLEVVPNCRWVTHGNIITSAGISAGIDMSLHIVSQLISQDVAEQTARQMEYDWQKQ